ncbi:MAG TPA: (Fe-S)-binding protein [Actinomycetota bacterium]
MPGPLVALLAFSLIGPVFLLLALALAGGAFSLRAYQLYRFVRLGRPVQRPRDLSRRVEQEATVVLGQRKLLQRLGPGLMHAFIFWGFLVLLTTILEAFGEVVQRRFAIPFIGHSAGLGLVQDLFAVLVIVGVEMAVFFRKVQRPDRFKGSHLEEADFILLMILGIMLTLLALNGSKIALGINESPKVWTPASNLVAQAFEPMSRGAVNGFEHLFLWAHILLILGFLAYIPYSKHLHIFVSEINVFFTNTRARGHLEPLHIDLESVQGNEVRLGAATVEDLTWKEILDTYSCTECGRCQSACPAWNTGKPLSPKLIVMNLRDHMFQQGPRILEAQGKGEDYEKVPLNPEVIEDEVIWDCVTCGACMQECPVNIEHVDHIVDMRRNLVMGESRFPAEAGTLLRNLENSSNPWGQPQSERADWARDLGVRVLEDGQAPEYLYWVGCAGSFDERARKISQAVVRVLQEAAIPFAILGPRELCNGDPARRIGNEYLYQELAKRNIETLNAAGASEIIVNCPHCLNTLKNEYPDFGGRYEVIHHTELFARLIAEGRLRPTSSVEEAVTYHDPCYLGRHNGVYDAPRKVLERIPGVRTTEMPRHRERSFCCGAGGSRMWLEEHLGKRINVERTEEAISTGAGTMGVACPFCLIMLDDGAKAKGERIQVFDVAQVLARSIQTEPRQGEAATRPIRP